MLNKIDVQQPGVIDIYLNDVKYELVTHSLLQNLQDQITHLQNMINNQSSNTLNNLSITYQQTKQVNIPAIAETYSHLVDCLTGFPFSSVVPQTNILIVVIIEPIARTSATSD